MSSEEALDELTKLGEERKGAEERPKQSDLPGEAFAALIFFESNEVRRPRNLPEKAPRCSRVIPAGGRAETKRGRSGWPPTGPRRGRCKPRGRSSWSTAS